MVVQAGSEDLRLVLQTAKCPCVDDAIAVTLEIVAVRVGELGVTPALRSLYRKPKAIQVGPAHIRELLGRHLAECGKRRPADRTPLGT